MTSTSDLAPLTENVRQRIGFSTSGCWLWKGTITDQGYGLMEFKGRKRKAHRLVYSLLRGPIPEGLQLDHLCRVRHCVNPDHLELVTGRENVLRSPIAWPAVNARKTHCIHGHEFTPENTRFRPNRYGGSRVCRECNRLRQRRRPEL